MKVNPNEDYGIFNYITKELIETHSNEETANHFAKVLNEHASKNKIDAEYVVSYRIRGDIWSL